MCLYPRLIRNKRYLGYKVTKKDALYYDNIDPRKLYVAIGCGECYECRRQKAQQWRVRLIEEMKVQKYAYFVTFTFSEDNLIQLAKDANCYIEKNGDYNPNKVATLAVRRFLERWRKKHKVSLKHWLINELGHEGTERVHLHGIIFNSEPISEETFAQYWKYGRIGIGEYCNLRTINYIVKYVTKVDHDHLDFKPIVLCSAGIGKAFVEDYNAKETYKYRPHQSKEYYLLNDGHKVALPIYYRNKFYTQKERDEMWTDRLDKNEIYVNGIRIRNLNTEEGYQNYIATLKTQQEWQNKIGYCDPRIEWNLNKYTQDWTELHGAPEWS